MHESGDGSRGPLDLANPNQLFGLFSASGVSLRRKHSSDFACARLTRNLIYGSHRTSFHLAFFHHEMIVAEAGDLGQMSDAEH